MESFIHPTAIVDTGAAIGQGCKIWHNAHIDTGATVGQGCTVGQNAYVAKGATVGNYCKLQNNVNVYTGVVLKDYVFCGPSMTFTNVKLPRCLYPTATEKYSATIVERGVSLGAHVTVICGIHIGQHAMAGSGAVITKDIPPYALVLGNPARLVGWVCACGQRLPQQPQNKDVCRHCGYQICL